MLLVVTYSAARSQRGALRGPYACCSASVLPISRGSVAVKSLGIRARRPRLKPSGSLTTRRRESDGT
jgi:hypothetical protein